MNTFPRFDETLFFLDQYIHELVGAYQSGRINSWDDLDSMIKVFFNPEHMDQTDVVAPGWKQMASYADGVTLTHVMCVFLGLFMLPEFQNLSDEQKQLAKWIVLFHDVEKIHIRGKRDNTHGFRSAAVTAGTLPGLGFSATAQYSSIYPHWKEITSQAAVLDQGSGDPIQDNTKLPEITSGIAAMFGSNSPAALIVQGVLFHMSINVVKDWPQAAPLTDEEIVRYISFPLAPLLKAMNLSDNDGWSIFDPDIRRLQRNETLDAFQEVEKLIQSDSLPGAQLRLK